MESSRKIDIQTISRDIFKAITGPNGEATPEGFAVVMQAIKAAESDYDWHDLHAGKEEKKPIQGIGVDTINNKSLAFMQTSKTLEGAQRFLMTAGFSLFVRMYTSYTRLPELKSATAENYKEKLYQFLLGDGGIEPKSLRSYVLKHLYFATKPSEKEKEEFELAYYNEKIELNTLKNLLCAQLDTQYAKPGELEKKAAEFMMAKLALSEKESAKLVAEVIQESLHKYRNSGAFSFLKSFSRSVDTQKITERNWASELLNLLSDDGKLTPDSLYGLVLKNLFKKCKDLKIENEFLEPAQKEELITEKEKAELSMKFDCLLVDLVTLYSHFFKLLDNRHKIQLQAFSTGLGELQPLL